MTNSFLQKHEGKYRQKTTQHLHTFLRKRRKHVFKNMIKERRQLTF